MDGNGRWATKRYLPRIAGHKQGVDALRTCVQACVDRGVGVLTVFAFSSENWNRPPEEVSGLMELLGIALAREVPRLQISDVRMHFVGDRQQLSNKVQAGLAQAELDTAGNQGLIFNVCFNYGGRWDVAQAAQKLVSSGQPITEMSLDRAMALAHVSDPDLLIRTGGEKRLSNFLLWQAAILSSIFLKSFGLTLTLQSLTGLSIFSMAVKDVSAKPPLSSKAIKNRGLSSTTLRRLPDAQAAGDHRDPVAGCLATSHVLHNARTVLRGGAGADCRWWLGMGTFECLQL